MNDSGYDDNVNRHVTKLENVTSVQSNTVFYLLSQMTRKLKCKFVNTDSGSLWCNSSTLAVCHSTWSRCQHVYAARPGEGDLSCLNIFFSKGFFFFWHQKGWFHPPGDLNPAACCGVTIDCMRNGCSTHYDTNLFLTQFWSPGWNCWLKRWSLNLLTNIYKAPVCRPSELCL